MVSGSFMRFVIVCFLCGSAEQGFADDFADRRMREDELLNVLHAHFPSDHHGAAVDHFRGVRPVNVHAEDLLVLLVDDHLQEALAFLVLREIAARETEDREYAPFGLIRDNYPKILLTLDPLRQQRDGIRHLNIIDVLLGREPLLP